MLDSLKFYESLKSGHLTDEQAQAVTQALKSAETDFIGGLDATVARLKDDLRATLRAQIDVQNERMEKCLEKLKNNLTWKIVGLWVAQFAVLEGLKLVK